MPGSFFLAITLLTASILALFWRRHKKKKQERIAAADESSLWVGLAAGLFDCADSPASARIEIALGAMAKKLKVRAGLVTAGNKNGRRVLASWGAESSLNSGLERGAMIANEAIYCGAVGTKGQLLAIDYASLSEWRKHPACRELGWESYLGLSCGARDGENVVVAFFDTHPRVQIFTHKEKILLEQLGPWIAAMVEDGEFPCASSDLFDYPGKMNSIVGEA